MCFVWPQCHCSVIILLGCLREGIYSLLRSIRSPQPSHLGPGQSQDLQP